MELIKQLIGIVLIAALIAGLAGLWAWASNKNAKNRAAAKKDSNGAAEEPAGCTMNCACCAASLNCSSGEKKTDEDDRH